MRDLSPETLRKLNSIVTEIFTTETSYIACLQSLIAWIDRASPIASKQEKKVLREIRDSVSPIYELHNRMLEDLQQRLSKLKAPAKELQQVAAVSAWMLHFLTFENLLPYKKHIANFDRYQEELSRVYQRYSKKIPLKPGEMDPPANNISPIQRLPRYQLFFIQIFNTILDAAFSTLEVDPLTAFLCTVGNTVFVDVLPRIGKTSNLKHFDNSDPIRAHFSTRKKNDSDVTVNIQQSDFDRIVRKLLYLPQDNDPLPSLQRDFGLIVELPSGDLDYVPLTLRNNILTWDFGQRGQIEMRYSQKDGKNNGFVTIGFNAQAREIFRSNPEHREILFNVLVEIVQLTSQHFGDTFHPVWERKPKGEKSKPLDDDTSRDLIKLPHTLWQENLLPKLKAEFIQIHNQAFFARELDTTHFVELCRKAELVFACGQVITDVGFYHVFMRLKNSNYLVQLRAYHKAKNAWARGQAKLSDLAASETAVFTESCKEFDKLYGLYTELQANSQLARGLLSKPLEREKTFNDKIYAELVTTAPTSIAIAVAVAVSSSGASPLAQTPITPTTPLKIRPTSTSTSTLTPTREFDTDLKKIGQQLKRANQFAGYEKFKTENWDTIANLQRVIINLLTPVNADSEPKDKIRRIYLLGDLDPLYAAIMQNRETRFIGDAAASLATDLPGLKKLLIKYREAVGIIYSIKLSAYTKEEINAAKAKLASAKANATQLLQQVEISFASLCCLSSGLGVCALDFEDEEAESTPQLEYFSSQQESLQNKVSQIETEFLAIKDVIKFADFRQKIIGLWNQDRDAHPRHRHTARHSMLFLRGLIKNIRPSSDTLSLSPPRQQVLRVCLGNITSHLNILLTYCDHALLKEKLVAIEALLNSETKMAQLSEEVDPLSKYLNEIEQLLQDGPDVPTVDLGEPATQEEKAIDPSQLGTIVEAAKSACPRPKTLTDTPPSTPAPTPTASPTSSGPLWGYLHFVRAISADLLSDTSKLTPKLTQRLQQICPGTTFSKDFDYYTPHAGAITKLASSVSFTTQFCQLRATQILAFHTMLQDTKSFRDSAQYTKLPDETKRDYDKSMEKIFGKCQEIITDPFNSETSGKITALNTLVNSSPLKNIYPAQWKRTTLGCTQLITGAAFALVGIIMFTAATTAILHGNVHALPVIKTAATAVIYGISFLSPKAVIGVSIAAGVGSTACSTGLFAKARRNISHKPSTEKFIKQAEILAKDSQQIENIRAHLELK